MATESKDKELERLQAETQALTTEISRYSLLRLSVAAFLILSRANAFKRADGKVIEPKMAEINSLRPRGGPADAVRRFARGDV